VAQTIGLYVGTINHALSVSRHPPKPKLHPAHTTSTSPWTTKPKRAALASAFAREHLTPRAARWDAKSEFPVDTFRRAAELGFGGVYSPEAVGGAGLSRAGARHVIACVCMRVCLHVHVCACVCVSACACVCARVCGFVLHVRVQEAGSGWHVDDLNAFSHQSTTNRTGHCSTLFNHIEQTAR